MFCFILSYIFPIRWDLRYQTDSPGCGGVTPHEALHEGNLGIWIHPPWVLVFVSPNGFFLTGFGRNFWMILNGFSQQSDFWKEKYLRLMHCSCTVWETTVMVSRSCLSECIQLTDTCKIHRQCPAIHVVATSSYWSFGSWTVSTLGFSWKCIRCIRGLGTMLKDWWIKIWLDDVLLVN